MNWRLDDFKDKDVVFIGLGKGRAAEGVRDFLEKYADIRSFIGIDKSPEYSFTELVEAYNPEHTVFIKNEGVPGREVPVPYRTPLQIFFDNVDLTGARTVGITGTKGKSTTTALTAHILTSAGHNAVLAGNIGISPLHGLASADSETVFVLELSSYQLADLTVSPQISACINLYNDHADVHGSLDNYWEAKHNIMRFAHENDVFIYNPDFLPLKEWAETAVCKTIAIDPTESLDLGSAALFGDHNRLNALVAREIARQFDVPDNVSQQAINSFEPLRHRMQRVATKDDVVYVDDAIGMTPEATMASLQAIKDEIGAIGCLLLGGQDRGYDFTALMQAVAAQNIPHLILFPDTIEKMKAALPAGYHPEIHESTSMDDAVTYAHSHTPKGSVVLLSTAAPSYSLWKDFEDKGDQFQTAVTALS